MAAKPTTGAKKPATTKGAKTKKAATKGPNVSSGGKKATSSKS